jgi:hypothetical protein
MEQKFARQLGFWASALAVVLGAIYLFLLVFHFSTEGFVNPTSGFVPLAAGIGTLLLVQVLVILFTAIHYVNEGNNKILGSLGVSFATLCAVAVSINRFVQLTVIQQSLPNLSSDLTRFLPYGAGSVMYSLEWLGWGFFSSLAALFVAPLFTSTWLNKTIRWLFVLYAIFSFMGLVGFMINTPIASIAFIAWGPILLTLSILLAFYFQKQVNK